MAEKKNFTIENYNGTDYDTLYPETNSGQVLLDSDAQVTTGLASGSTLDDVLQSVVKDGGAFHIGDTLTTARTNLGDKWLLCNGRQITQTDYPVLVGLLGYKPFSWVSKGTSTTANINNIVNKTTATGDLFLAKSDTKVDNAYHCYYSTDLLSWQSLKTNSRKFYIWCVNGTWIIYSDYAAIVDEPKKASYYSGENMDFDNFTAINGITESIAGVAYWNGKYYLSTTSSDSEDNNGYIYIYTDLSQPPVKISVGRRHSGSALTGALTVVPEGVVLCEGSTSSGNATYDIHVVDAQNSVSKYGIATITGYYASPQSIQCFNGYYYMTTYYKSTSGPSVLNHTLFRSTTLNGSYSKVKYNNTTDVTANTITITDDYLITDTGYYIDTENNVYKQANPITATVPILVGKDKYYTMVNTTAYQSNIADSAYLPEVDTGYGLYTYIKAKS